MKFAKQLKSAQQAEWRGQYVDYKLLKQKLHGFVETSAVTNQAGQSTTADHTNQHDNNSATTAVSSSPQVLTIQQIEEVDDAFFITLRTQADKCEAFYLYLVDQLRGQQQRVFFEDYQKHSLGVTTITATAHSPSVSPLPSPLHNSSPSPFSTGPPAPSSQQPSGSPSNAPLSASPETTAPSSPLTPDAVVAFGQRTVTYAELNKLAIQKILKKHRKRFDATLSTVQSADPSLIAEVRDRSLAVEKGIVDTLKRSRSFWTRRQLESILEEIKAFRWQHVKEQAHLLKCAIP
ncbi:hypothetical protein BDF19DRAFT_233095 [Syncephalis fuscata]|nr:hypothetical protein BDF19DRAFT_233095 [Syncephalis fuscata]